MTRPIKFRAWMEEKMEYNPRLPFPNVGFDIPVNDIFEVIHFGEKVVWMQFTGLLDKNGKEIYEGDIVKYNNPSDGDDLTLEVQFFDGRFSPFGQGGVYPQECEVIGNIWENPEGVIKIEPWQRQ